VAFSKTNRVDFETLKIYVADPVTAQTLRSRLRSGHPERMSGRTDSRAGSSVLKSELPRPGRSSSMVMPEMERLVVEVGRIGSPTDPAIPPSAPLDRNRSILQTVVPLGASGTLQAANLRGNARAPA